jgi:hypothetical protein
VSLNKEKVSREIRENKIAVCDKTQGLWSGNFSDLNSACSKVLVILGVPKKTCAVWFDVMQKL